MAQRYRCAALALIIMLFFTACARKTEIIYVDRPVTVEVPVAVTPEIEPIKAPRYKLNELSKTSSPREVAEAYATTVKQMHAYIRRLESALKPLYKKDFRDADTR